MLAPDIIAHLPPDTLGGVITLSGPPDVPRGFECLQPVYTVLFPRLMEPAGVSAYRANLQEFSVRFARSSEPSLEC
jgi:hypothetical protein